MRRDVMWRAWEGPGLENLRLEMDDDGVVADGLVMDYPGLFKRALP